MALLLGAAALLGAGATQHARHDHGASHAAVAEAPAAQKIWACPMHPHIMQDHPGSCPICGMDLVEADGMHVHDAEFSAPLIAVDAAMRQRLGVRLASLEPRRLSRPVQTYGNVVLDENALFDVSPKIDGWIRKLHVTVGQQVRAGQVLYEIYSPELVQRQREYIALLQRRDQLRESASGLTGQNAQVAASLARERVRSREKFGYADMDDETLERLEQHRRTIDVIPVRAPRAGFVTRIDARAGSYVTPLVKVLSLADSGKLWVDIALYPDQLEWVAAGDAVTVGLPHADRPALHGRLRFASPVTDVATRTARARVVIDQAQPWLRPGALVDVTIATAEREALVLPRSAVMRTGRGSRVMLARGDGHFTPVPVETGLEDGELIEIADGLQEGAQVAVNGQFLLDAAASLSDAAQRMRQD